VSASQSPVVFSVCSTEFGWVGVAAKGEHLIAITLPEPTERDALAALRESCGPAQHDASAPSEIERRLQAYFQGEEVTFADLLLDTSIGTPFQRRVWEATRGIPRGQTRTYGELARESGSPRAARAIGQAMARNPWPIVVPCHRVVGHDGRLTGFGGGLEMKRRMLDLEKPDGAE